MKFEEGHGTICASNKVKMNTSKFVEGTTNSEHDDSPRPDHSEADGPSGGKTKLNAYQTPSQTEHTWHKSSRDKKTSKHTSERSRACRYVEKGNETLRTKNESKKKSVTIFYDVDVKNELRDPERLNSHDKDIASARADVCEVHGECEGKDAPNSNGDRTMTHPKNGFSKGETRNGYRDRNIQYGGNMQETAAQQPP